MTTSIGRPAKHTYFRKNLTKTDKIIISVLKSNGADQDYITIPQVKISILTGLYQSQISEGLDRLTWKGYVDRVRVTSKEDAIKLIKS